MKKNHDDEDVKALLERETHDGPGFEHPDELPPSDFESYATDGVEEEE